MPDVKFSNQYPYTDFHELNLDWVIKEVKYWSTKVGKTIQSIDLTGTAGLVDTYTINYSDGSTSTFTVTNGKGITSITKTGTAGLVDTYTVAYTDGTSTTFDVTNGNGIASIDKTGSAGLVDTYTITFTDGSTTTFDVNNGTASIDATLSNSGRAADAKVTGDIFRLDNKFIWEPGGVNETNGTTAASAVYVRTYKIPGTIYNIKGLEAFNDNNSFIALYNSGSYVGYFTPKNGRFLNPDGSVHNGPFDHDEFIVSCYFSPSPNYVYITYAENEKTDLFTTVGSTDDLFYYAGALTSLSGVSSTQMYPVIPGRQIRIATPYSGQAGGHRLDFFDASKTYISEVAIDYRAYYYGAAVPSNAAYMSLAYYNPDDDVTKVHLYQFMSPDEYRKLIPEKPRSFSILGDSYSTYDGYVDPSTNAVYYPLATVDSVNKTYWHILSEKNKMLISQNNSYSGAAVSYYGYGGDTPANRAMSFVTRVENLRTADIIFIEGGTNDSFAGTPLGSYVYSGFTEADLLTFRGAYAYVVDYIISHNPASRIICINNSHITSANITTSISTIAAHYGVEVLDIGNVGFASNHPTAAGMLLLSKKTSDFIA